MVDVSIDFVFRYCHDIDAVRHFYSDILLMEEAGFSKEHGYLIYQCNGFQMIFNVGQKVKKLDEFSNQPGQNKGQLEEISFAVRVPEDKFETIVNQFIEKGVPALFESIRWNGYWSYIVQDPMGVTIDVYFEPEIEPSTKEWSFK